MTNESRAQWRPRPGPASTPCPQKTRTTQWDVGRCSVGVPNLQGLMPEDLRWSWRNNRNTVHSKCAWIIPKPFPLPSLWKQIPPWNLVSKGLGTTALKGSSWKKKGDCVTVRKASPVLGFRETEAHPCGGSGNWRFASGGILATSVTAESVYISGPRVPSSRNYPERHHESTGLVEGNVCKSEKCRNNPNAHQPVSDYVHIRWSAFLLWCYTSFQRNTIDFLVKILPYRCKCITAYILKQFIKIFHKCLGKSKYIISS